jgi:hypothetical protein
MKDKLVIRCLIDKLSYFELHILSKLCLKAIQCIKLENGEDPDKVKYIRESDILAEDKDYTLFNVSLVKFLKASERILTDFRRSRGEL